MPDASVTSNTESIEIERKRLVDGFSTLERGVHEGLNASLLPANQAARLINATVRGGYPTCRPDYSEVDLTFEDAEQQYWFENYNVQGRYIYRPVSNGVPFVVAVIGGRVFKIDVERGTGTNVQELSGLTDRNPSNRPRAWLEQAEQYLIIQDGQSTPWIFDGAALRRASLGEPDYEVPVGTAMAYGMGRLVVVRPHRRSYVIGDIIHGGTEVIQFTEENYLNEGGDVTVPIQGEITSVKIVAQLDRSTGHGDLMVMTPYGAASAKIGEKRETWKDIQFQQVAMLGSGPVSHNSVVQVNGDFLYRARDGIRSLALTRRDFQSSWATTPLSREVNRTLGFDSPNWLEFCDATLFDNRLLVLCNQNPVRNGCYHRGIVALDFDLISSMGQKQPPAYDGLWIGLRASAIVSDEFPNGARCFVFHRNSSGKNELWEIQRTSTGKDNGTTRIQWSIESPALLKDGSMPFSLKHLNYGDVSLEEMFGDVDLDVKFKPDSAPCYTDWRTWTGCARNRICDGETCETPVVHYKPQYRAKIRLGQPPDGCSPSDNKPVRLGFEFQVELNITGKATVTSFRLAAIEQEEPLDGCTPSETQ